MATQAYRDWIADGSPFTVARPILETKAKLRAAGVTADLGTLGDLPHLTADKPQDHCPFSFTGWPLLHPYPYVTAIDYMHQPDKGMDCDSYFRWRLAEAKAGRTPWTKYLTWQAKRYDVRNNWAPVDASGHFDHMHESIRTDWHTKSIGAWPAIGDMMTDLSYDPRPRPKPVGDRSAATLLADIWGQEIGGESPVDGDKSHRTEQLNRLEVMLKELLARPPVQAGPVDLGALRAIVREEIDKTKLGGA